jgi:hypothetical protein
MMTALSDALLRDPNPSVRLEAASTLGKLRPITQSAGYTLEQAQDRDSSLRVRNAARMALWQYHLVGYRSGKAPEKPAEPSADQSAAQPPSAHRLPPAPSTVKTPQRLGVGPRGETPEPPLAGSAPGQRTVSQVPVPRSRLQPPNPVTLQPVSTPKLLTPPASNPTNPAGAPEKTATGEADAPKSADPIQPSPTTKSGNDGPELSPPG